MTNDSTVAPARATSKALGRKTQATTSPADGRPEVIRQLTELGEHLGSIYTDADKLTHDAWVLIGRAADRAEQIAEQWNKPEGWGTKNVPTATLLGWVQDFRAYWRGAELVPGEESVDALPEDTTALGFLQRKGDVVRDLLVSLRAQCEAEGSQPERPRVTMIEPDAAALKRPTVAFLDQANDTFRKVRAALILLEGAISGTPEKVSRVAGIVGVVKFMSIEMTHLREACDEHASELDPLYWAIHHSASIIQMLEEHEHNNSFTFEFSVAVYVDILFAARCDIEAGQAALARMEAA